MTHTQEYDLVNKEECKCKSNEAEARLVLQEFIKDLEDCDSIEEVQLVIAVYK